MLAIYPAEKIYFGKRSAVITRKQNCQLMKYNAIKNFKQAYPIAIKHNVITEE